MKIFIIGAGFTGMQLARALVLEQNSVVLIDNDPERVRDAETHKVTENNGVWTVTAK